MQPDLRTYLLAFAIILTICLPNVAGTGASIRTQSSQTSSTLSEWTVPTPASGPLALTLDQKGVCCWFLEYYASKVAHLNPSTGVFQEWSIPTSNANPYSLAITSIEGSTVLWGTEYGSDSIFAFFPESGLFLEYSIPGYQTGVGYISVEPPSAQVRVWFTETTRNLNGEFIYDPITKNGTLYTDSFPAAVGGGAYGVYAGVDSVWFAGFSALVRWDRASQQYTMYPYPTHGASVGRSITLDQYGEPWYTQGLTDASSNDNFVGVLRGNSSFEEWRIPRFGADPRGIDVNPLTQQPWIAEQSSSAGNGTVATLDTSSGGTFVPSTSTTALSGGTPTILSPTQTTVSASISNMTPLTKPILDSQVGQFTEFPVGSTLPRDVVVDSSGNVWLSEPRTNNIARLSLSPDFALRASPPIISLPQGGSGVVNVTGASISSYTGQVSLTITSSPRGVTFSSFTTNPLNIPSEATASSQFTINVGPNASVGSNSIIIQGSDGSVTHKTGLILSITNSTTSGLKCLIATATYGSELSPEVQLLRNFRDNSLAKTRIGSSFLLVFNAWYYSFSPAAANYLDNHAIARTLMKGVLYPLIVFLFLASKFYSGLSAFPELATVISGVLASMLIGGFYIGLPLGLLKRRLRSSRKFHVRIWAGLLLGGMVTILLGQILVSTFLLMISTSLTVIVAMLASAALAAATISRAVRRTKQGSK